MHMQVMSYIDRGIPKDNVLKCECYMIVYCVAQVSIPICDIPVCNIVYLNIPIFCVSV